MLSDLGRRRKPDPELRSAIAGASSQGGGVVIDEWYISTNGQQNRSDGLVRDQARTFEIEQRRRDVYVWRNGFEN